jgi:hypothetical protein
MTKALILIATLVSCLACTSREFTSTNAPKTVYELPWVADGAIVAKVSVDLAGYNAMKNFSPGENGIFLRFKIDNFPGTDISVPGGQNVVYRSAPLDPGKHELSVALYSGEKMYQHRTYCLLVP